MNKIIATLFLSFTLLACSAGQSQNKTSKKVNPIEFNALSVKENTIILDVRTPQEFNLGHIPKAQNIDFRSSDFENLISSLDKETTYLVYCHSGVRSSNAISKMKKLGFKYLYDLKGGFVSYKNQITK
ncbi:MAG: rhodanese-like domain-containing protein [Flavobacteriales bacterium]